MTSRPPDEALMTYPGSTGAGTRGFAHLMRFGRVLIAVGELDDNPADDIVDSIEMIAAGLLASGLAEPGFTLLHYIRRDHTRGGDAALWQISWRSRDAAGEPVHQMPVWEPVAPELEWASQTVLSIVGDIEPYDEQSILERTSDVFDLFDDADIIDLLNDALRAEHHQYLWQEIAEMAYGPEAIYENDSGHVRELEALQRAAPDRWLVEVAVDLQVHLQDEGLPAEASRYKVSLTVADRSFPASAGELWVVG